MASDHPTFRDLHRVSRDCRRIQHRDGRTLLLEKAVRSGSRHAVGTLSWTLFTGAWLVKSCRIWSKTDVSLSIRDDMKPIWPWIASSWVVFGVPLTPTAGMLECCQFYKVYDCVESMIFHGPCKIGDRTSDSHVADFSCNICRGIINIVHTVPWSTLLF